MVIIVLALAGCTVNSETGKNAEASQITVATPTNVHEAVLDIEGMTCTSCALGVEYQLKQVDGVLDAKINYEEGKGYITYDADKISAESIAQASDIYPATVSQDKKI